MRLEVSIILCELGITIVYVGLQEEQVKRVLRAIITGLEFMHGEGLVHRNLRAKNVLIFDRQSFERVKITDLALTRKKGTQASAQAVRLTMTLKLQVKHIDNPNEYHAPELCEILIKEQFTVNPSVDIWAVGVSEVVCALYASTKCR